MHRYGSMSRRRPGSLVYFGGAVHEVMSDGHTFQERRDLVPDSPKRWWKPLLSRGKAGTRTMKRRYGVVNRQRRAFRTRLMFGPGRHRDPRGRRWPKSRLRLVSRGRGRGRWIQHALRFHKKGSLHRMLGIPLHEKIPTSRLLRAVRDPRSSKLLRQRAHLALTLRHYRGPR